MPALAHRPTRTQLAVGLAAVVAGALAWVGAVGTWVGVRLFGVHLSMAGTSPQLDGSVARALGIAGVVLGVLVPFARHRLHLAGLIGLAGVAAAGLGVVGHEAYHLENVDRWLRDIPHLEQFVHALGIDAGAGWGLYMTGAAFGLMLVAAMSGLWLERQSRRKAPPSTGMAHPVRYDAAGDSANAAT